MLFISRRQSCHSAKRTYWQLLWMHRRRPCKDFSSTLRFLPHPAGDLITVPLKQLEALKDEQCNTGTALWSFRTGKCHSRADCCTHQAADCLFVNRLRLLVEAGMEPLSNTEFFRCKGCSTSVASHFVWTNGLLQRENYAIHEQMLLRRRYLAYSDSSFFSQKSNMFPFNFPI